MHRELEISARHYHDHYLRSNVRIPDPLDRSRHELRKTIGQSLIHIGERIARVDDPQLDEAA